MILSYGRFGYGFGLTHNGRIFFSLIDLDGVEATNRITDTEWHHLAVTRSRDTVIFYVDGLPASEPISIRNWVFKFDTSVSVGSRGDGRGNSLYGMIDDLTIFDRPLSDKEIAFLFNASSPAPIAEVAVEKR